MKKYLLIAIFPLFLLGNSGFSFQKEIHILEKQEMRFLSLLQTEHKKELLLQSEKKEKEYHTLVNYKYNNALLVSKLKKLYKEYPSTIPQIIQKENEHQEELRKLALKKRQNRLVAKIDISTQHMQVYKGNKLLYKWKISSGKKNHATPRGYYKPTHIAQKYFSRKYNNAPMPYAVFFRSGYAIHGTKSVSRLGSPASHGCIRLHTNNAKKFYTLVKQAGQQNTTISIIN